MIIGNKRVCDECRTENAYHYILGIRVIDLCDRCATQYNILKL